MGHGACAQLYGHDDTSHTHTHNSIMERRERALKKVYREIREKEGNPAKYLTEGPAVFAILVVDNFIFFGWPFGDGRTNGWFQRDNSKNFFNPNV